MATIAHVGDIGSKDDVTMRTLALAWVIRNKDFRELLLNCDPDLIDLRYGRDFLTENQTYDFVVVHRVFNPPWYNDEKQVELIVNELGRGKSFQRKEYLRLYFTTSPLHEWARWVERLESCRAKAIILFGGEQEVSGQFIASLDGYDRVEDRCGMTVFQARTQSQTLVSHVEHGKRYKKPENV